MSTPLPIKVLVYDKHFQPRGTVGNPIFVTIIPKWITAGVGQATISVAADHPRMPDLLAEGAWLVLSDVDSGEHLMTGRVLRFRVAGPQRRSTVEFDIADAARVFQYVLGWVIPSAAITAQGTGSVNWTLNDSAETVMLAAMQANAVDRLGLPILIPASQDRGPAVKGRLRFQSIHDRLIATEDGAGIENSGLGFGLKMREERGAGLEMFVWEPRVVPQTLTEDSGIVSSWGLSRDHATATRVVVGGSGEGIERVLRERVDATLETALGWKEEVFRDARDTDDPAVMYERADETLAENGPKSGLSVELSETAHFIPRPGKLWVGDQVTLELADIPVTNRLSEVTLSATADAGYVTRSRVGDVTDSADRKLAKRILQIARKLRIANSDR